MKLIIHEFWMVMVMLGLSISAYAYDFEVDGVFYTVTDLEKFEIEVANPFPNEPYTKTEIVIPSEIVYNGRTFVPVRIGERAFYYTKNLKSVSLPSSIKSIGKGAFQDSGLFTINLNDGLK
ncbi:MAG: leucine-rich repeat domain-containing protein, partial [Paramuribaculum sp.]|nr:leucine-rich repeat domain-containing protein [Paramuribaculum sp.]